MSEESKTGAKVYFIKGSAGEKFSVVTNKNDAKAIVEKLKTLGFEVREWEGNNR